MKTKVLWALIALNVALFVALLGRVNGDNAAVAVNCVGLGDFAVSDGVDRHITRYIGVFNINTCMIAGKLFRLDRRILGSNIGPERFFRDARFEFSNRFAQSCASGSWTTRRRSRHS